MPCQILNDDVIWLICSLVVASAVSPLDKHRAMYKLMRVSRTFRQITRTIKREVDTRVVNEWCVNLNVRDDDSDIIRQMWYTRNSNIRRDGLIKFNTGQTNILTQCAYVNLLKAHVISAGNTDTHQSTIDTIGVVICLPARKTQSTFRLYDRQHGWIDIVWADPCIFMYSTCKRNAHILFVGEALPEMHDKKNIVKCMYVHAIMNTSSSTDIGMPQHVLAFLKNEKRLVHLCNKCKCDMCMQTPRYYMRHKPTCDGIPKRKIREWMFLAIFRHMQKCKHHVYLDIQRPKDLEYMHNDITRYVYAYARLCVQEWR